LRVHFVFSELKIPALFEPLNGSPSRPFFYTLQRNPISPPPLSPGLYPNPHSPFTAVIPRRFKSLPFLRQPLALLMAPSDKTPGARGPKSYNVPTPPPVLEFYLFFLLPLYFSVSSSPPFPSFLSPLFLPFAYRSSPFSSLSCPSFPITIYLPSISPLLFSDLLYLISPFTSTFRSLPWSYS
jgi:hypothetical protein